MTQHAQLAGFGLFDQSVPRYTSYPTAAQFGAGVTAADHADWLARVPAGSAISLYLHVPFCRRLCWFCACRTQGTSTLAPVAAYVETLLAEISSVRARMAPGIRLSRLHWGGGTPTLLSPDLITRLAEAITLAFPLADGAEVSVEIDPDEVDDARLDALAAMGMNRASIGVQDFDPAIQRAIGRIQPYELTRDVAQAIRARGVRGLNTDLLYGLPYQTEEGIARSVDQVLSLQPDRVALYGYAHVPWMSRRQQMIPEQALPAPPDRLDLFLRAADQFAHAGYVAVGIDHFALPTDGLARAAAAGRLRRNFQGYTDDTAPVLVGIGASAISRLPQGYVQNAPATADYTRAVRAGELPTHRGHAFAGEDLLRARMIEMIMCDGGLDLASIRKDFPGDQASVQTIADRILARFGSVLIKSDDRLDLTDRGRLLARLVARTCDAYAGNPVRGSSAI
jgi:oxygen-independent coproporphyrinogen-3 oxidase